MRARFLVLPVFLLFTGCGAFDNILTPETPAERLAAAEIAVQEQAIAIGKMADAGIIAGENATLARESLAAVRQSLVAARAAVRVGVDPRPELRALESGLSALLQYIERNQKDTT